MVRLLHQDDGARKRRGIFVPRPFHRRATDGFAQHVVAQRPEIPIGERFEVDDRRVGLPVARRSDLIVGKSFGPERRHVTRQIRPGHRLRETHALNTGPPCARPILIADETAPFVARDLLRAVGKKRHAAAQDGLAVLQSVQHLGLDLFAVKFEIVPFNLLLRRVHETGDSGGGEQPNQKNGQAQEKPATARAQRRVYRLIGRCAHGHFPPIAAPPPSWATPSSAPHRPSPAPITGGGDRRVDPGVNVSEFAVRCMGDELGAVARAPRKHHVTTLGKGPHPISSDNF